MKALRNTIEPLQQNQRIQFMSPKENLVPPGSSSVAAPIFEALKILFLDIDGILNSAKTYVIHGHMPNYVESRKVKDAYVEHVEAFDPCAIALVNQLCKVTGAFIVLSSSWRESFDTWEVKEMLAEIGVNPDYVIGRTDDILNDENRKLSRSDQIERFLLKIQNKEGLKELLDDRLLDDIFKDADKVKVISYVILEDDEDMSPVHKSNLVRVMYRDGLTLTDTLQAGEILQNDGTFYLNALQGKPSVGEPGWNLH